MFQPVVPIGGAAGWAFLTRTAEAQKAAFTQAPSLKRDTDYFRDKIGEVRTASDLVSDRRLLRVALGAFGLEGDLNNRAFIQRILQDGTLETGSLANRLSDKRYQDFSAAFGFGDFDIPRTQLSDFGEEIVAKFETQQFESAIGAQNADMRLLMGMGRDLENIAGGTNTDDGKWFAVMGTPPLRAVFETALGLPTAVGGLDIDQQLELFKDRAQRAFGTADLSEIAGEEKRGELTRLFLARAEIRDLASAAPAGASAISLMQSSVALARSLGART